MKRPMAKAWRVAAIVAALGIVAAACGSSSKKATAGGRSADSASSEPTTGLTGDTTSTAAPANGTAGAADSTTTTAARGKTTGTAKNSTATTTKKAAATTVKPSVVVNAVTGTLTNVTTANAVKIDESAVLKIGDRIAEATYRPVFDPIKQNSARPEAYLSYVYDTLLVRNINGQYAPSLATQANVMDSKTITVVLRSGVKFQDGTDLTADAEKQTLLRNRDNFNANSMRAPMQQISTVDVTGPLTLTIHLATPVAGAFYDLLAHSETAPVSPAALASGTDLTQKPVGAGPFKLVTNTDNLIQFQKWTGYWDAQDVHLSGIDLVYTASSEAVISGMSTGAIDWSPLISATEYAQLQKGNLTTRTTPFDGQVRAMDFVALACAKNADALGDPRVRQALIYATDRNAINKIVYQGGADIATQMAPVGTPLYDASLDSLYPYDPDKAKALLTAAGKSNLTLSLYLAQSAVGQQVVTIVQQQWGQVGIKVNLVGSANTTADFFQNGTIQSIFNPAQAFFGSDALTTWFDPNSIGGTCPATDPSVLSEVSQLQGLALDSPQGIKAYQDIDRYAMQNALLIPMFLDPTYLAWNKRLAQVTFKQSRTGIYHIDFRGTAIAKS
jgi:peptide/nickel transport system substrate-binding protein